MIGLETKDMPIRELERVASEIDVRIIPLSVTKSINRALTATRTAASKSIRQAYNVNATEIRETFVLRRARRDRLEGLALSRGFRIPLSRFAARQTKRAVTGSLAAQEVGNDTAAIAGTTTVTGTVTAQEVGDDVAAIAGTIAITGSLGAQEIGQDTVAITGTAAQQGAVTGTLAAQEVGQDVCSVTVTVTVTGTVSAQEQGADHFSASGNVLVEGTLAAQEVGNDSVLMFHIAHHRAPECRVYAVPADDRRITIPADDRRITVRPC